MLQTFNVASLVAVNERLCVVPTSARSRFTNEAAFSVMADSSRFSLQLLIADYLPAYVERQPLTIHKHIVRLRNIEPSLDYFSFLVASSIFSSRIEGSTVDLNDYYRFQELGLKKTKPIQEVDDLIRAYQWAKKGAITEKRLLTAHKYLNSGQVVYRGATAAIVQQEVRKLLADIQVLTDSDLTHNEVFYFAAQIQLRFSQIHPFADGNGRMARLLEKWFLSQMLGDVAWYIQSERNYQRRLSSYYRNIHLGPDYDQVNYDRSLPFLLMLPWSLRLKAKG